MPKINLDAIPQVTTSRYPAPFHEPMSGRLLRRLAPTSGLSALGASHVILTPGAWSSQRHWHEGEDELLIMLSGEATLIEGDGETLVYAGDVLAWPKGIKNGHHLINRSETDCSFVVVSAGLQEGGAYSDIDMLFTADGRYTRKDGTDYGATRG